MTGFGFTAKFALDLPAYPVDEGARRDRFDTTVVPAWLAFWRDFCAEALAFARRYGQAFA